MRIRKLELVGFKSFKDRTIVEFDSDITSVVGPNGCGKSNIVDAFCWVMGEMSAKSLRGSSMEDVIFQGAEGYAPSGMAEVSLTLEQGGGSFPVQFADQSELQLTRRLHRSGASEYLVNNKPARLKDIQEVFMDVSAGGFSVIEQGSIGKMVVAKPEERRYLIEEIAGIAKFKSRRREAQRKLERTENNLQRVNDIINELKRQLDFLKRQASKAQKYKELKDSARQLDLSITSHKYGILKDDLLSAEKSMTNYEDKILEIEGRISSFDNQISVKNLEILELEKTINDSKSNLDSKKETVKDQESEITRLEWQLEEASREKEKLLKLNSEQKEKKVNLENDLNNIGNECKELALKAKKTSDEYNEFEQNYSELKDSLTSVKDSAKNKRLKIYELDKEKAELNVKLSSSKVRLEEYNKRIDDIIKLKESLCEKKQSLEKDIEIVNRKLSDSKENLNKTTLPSLLENKDQMQSELGKKLNEVENFKNKLNETKAKLYSLETLHKNFEGFQTGIKSLMKRNRELSDKKPGQGLSMMPISEIVQVDKKYELAMEASLGLKLQTLVAPSHEVVLEAVDYLKQNNQGRSSFVSNSKTQSKKQVCKESNVVGMLSSYVSSDKKYKDIVGNMIDGIAVVNSIDDAVSLSKNYPDNTFVTLDGDLYSNGILTAGTPESADSGVLKRRREIKELTQLKTEWEGKLYLAKESFKKIDKSLIDLNSKIDNIKNDVKDFEISITELTKDSQRLEAESLKIDEELAQKTTEQDNYSLQKNDLEKSVSDYSQKINSLEQDKDKIKLRVR